MKKIAIIYWSGTGNTAAMASAVANGIKDAGADAVMLTASEFDASMMDSFDAVAFGCPSMGAEELEESEFAPMFDACEEKLSGKKSLYSALMVGATENGCATGKRSANMTAQS